VTSISRFTPPTAMPQGAVSSSQDVGSPKKAGAAPGLADAMTGPIPAEIGQSFGMRPTSNPLKLRLPDPLGMVQAGALPSQAKMPDLLTTAGIILFGDLKDLVPKATASAPAAPQPVTAPTQAQMTDALTKLAYILTH
jgi:hypothetical protein